VPTDDSFGRDDDESMFPSCPESTNGDPEELVDQCQSWPRMATFQDGELLTKRENLQDKVRTITKEAKEDSKPEGK
jgi:hypothetical protein